MREHQQLTLRGTGGSARPEEVEVVGIDRGERRSEAEKDDPIQRLTASHLDSLGGEVEEEVAILLHMAARPGKVYGDGTSSRPATAGLDAGRVLSIRYMPAHDTCWGRRGR